MTEARTCYVLCVTAALATGHEDDIALARVGISVFEKEKLVDAIVLERRDFGYGAYGAGEALFDDEVFLAANSLEEI